LRLPIHREGWPFIAIAMAASALLFIFAGWAGWLFVPLTLWVILFFRDPERAAPQGLSLILSPADGRMLPIVQEPAPSELGMGGAPMTRISIFMNVFNVHVNRIPCNGTVTGLAYRPGKFFNASFDKASVHNERMSIRLRLSMPEPGGVAREIAVVQIAGLVARRIGCELREGQTVCQGDRFGIIRFGSRLDVYLPAGVRVLVSAGQNVRAGETVLASFPA
jgi:phosphatidylserine decarboxylase